MAACMRLLAVNLCSTLVIAQDFDFWPDTQGGGATARGLAVNTSDEESGGAYQDVEPADCTLGQNCTDGGIPLLRGICVVASNPGAGKACWDVCNPAHLPQTYKVNSDNAAVTMSYAGMVESVRAGLNPMVRCPGSLGGGDPCPPGEACSYEMRKEFDIPKGRGMCVIDAHKPNFRACWDMCDGHRSPEAYTMGTPMGTAATVWNVRSSGVCPGTPWWAWILVALGFVSLLACCAGGAYLFRTRLSRRLRSRGAPINESRKSEDFNQDYDEPLNEGNAEAPEDPYVQQEQFQRESAPPEPPRGQATMQQSVYTQGVQQTAPSVDLTGTAGMPRIPGLDEPNLLLGNIPALQAPAAQQQFYIPSATQNASPVIQSSFQVGAPAVVMSSTQVPISSFHTSAPAIYTAGTSPPASMQMLAPAQQQQQFFPQVQQRR